nr:hypothetical protein [Tanacetum cinerariifolium]
AFQKDLHDLEIVIDQGNATDDILYKRVEIIKDIQEAEKVDNLEAAQKAKIKWAIEGDENIKFYHGILNKKCNQLGIHGVLNNGMWIDNTVVVKKEFLEHFSTRFQQPRRIRSVINIDFPYTIRYVLNHFGFGAKWCGWIQECLRSSCGSVLVNGSPTEEFQFYKGLKQGDPLSLFLCILVMESLHLSFKRVEDAGRLTLLKAVFGSMPIYHMSIFKVSWNKVLTSKEKGGIGVSSLFALNRALMFKWVWRFFNPSDSLWVRVIHAIHGVDGRIGREGNVGYTSIWCDIIKEMDRLASHGIDLITFKFEQTALFSSLRKMPRSGVGSEQWDHLLDSLEGVMLNPSKDRWSCDLNGSGEFLVASARRYIDKNRLPDISSKTRWIKEVPIKVNVHAWKV